MFLENKEQRDELRQITQLTKQQQDKAIKNISELQQNDISGVKDFVGLQQEEVQNIKKEIVQQNEGYLKQHPEIKRMLNIFMIKILHERPDDIVTFTGNFFSKQNKKITFKRTC